MSRDLIFGSNVVLPSFPDLKSNCEEELTLLMREIDLVMQKKLEDSSRENSRLHSLCQAQKDEIENLKFLLHNKQAGKEINENQKKFMKEIEKLKEEIIFLKRENTLLQQKAEDSIKCKYELEMLKKELQKEEEENTALRTRFIKLDEESRTLKNNCQKLANIVALDEAQKFEGNKQETKMAADAVDNLIELELEKYAREETEVSDELQFRLTNIIHELEKKLEEIF